MGERLIDLLFGIMQSLIVAGITASVAVFFTKKYYSKVLLANKLKKSGFHSVRMGKPTKQEWKELFDVSSRIRIMYVSGFNFFNGNKELIKNAIRKGKKIEILVSESTSRFLNDIEYLEKNAGIREKNTYISKEIEKLRKNIEDIKREIPNLADNIEIRFFGTEYRLPFVYGEYVCEKQNTQKHCIRGFLYITLPPYKSTKSCVLELKRDWNSEIDEEFDIVEMVEKHFEAVWDKESYKKYWEEKQSQAKLNMVARKGNDKILIECAAQHPLVNGKEPGQEFTERLNMAYELYKNLTSKGEKVDIYVPGSTHLHNQIPEECSLSDAGKDYLEKRGIPQANIFGNEKNIEYKKDVGVYNSADECYVASQIFLEGNYKELVCVCSSNQTIRKTLFYYSFGVSPKCYGVPSENMFHNVVGETQIAYNVLCGDHDWQEENSKYYMDTREERKPKR